MKLSSEERKAKREEKLAYFNPNENGLAASGIFGLPFEEAESEVVLFPVPWEVTVSYGGGTVNGPNAILKASQQIDLYDPIAPDGWRIGIAMQEPSKELKDRNANARAQAALYLQEADSQSIPSRGAMQILSACNRSTEDVMDWVYRKSVKVLDQGKILGVIGGEHSVPFGAMKAVAERFGDFGILQIDAHADLRNAYQGFKYSHASIMYNALQIEKLQKLVQVGIRDFAAEENELVQNSAGRVAMFTDYEINRSRYEGKTWKEICENIVELLPQNVYISYDIDGLQPWLCPNTGTPVPGGFLLEEASYLIEKVVESGRKIVGFDLCEVAPGADEWDGNVGSRVLYKLCLLAAKSNGLLS